MSYQAPSSPGHNNRTPDTIPWDSLTRCQQGDSLLKFGRQGDPHFRNFKISTNFECITWRSKGKLQQIPLANVAKGGGFLPGNLHGLFKRNTKKRYDARVCFSLDYTTKTLDLVCSDTDQYHAWSEAITYLLANGPPLESERPESTKMKNMKNDQGNDDEGDDNLGTRVWTNNDIYSWGFGGQGQLGHSGANIQQDLTTPTIVRQMLGKNVLGIACGLEHTVAIVKPGLLWSWGHGGGGRLGTQEATQLRTAAAASTTSTDQDGNDALLHELTPAAVVGASGVVFVSVACGDYHTLGLTSAGQVHSWGSGFYGQLGRSEYAQTGATITQVDDIEDVVAIQASYTTSAAVSSSGALYTWGSGECGKLGHGKSGGEESGGPGEEGESKTTGRPDQNKTVAEEGEEGEHATAAAAATVTFDDVYVPRIVSGLSSYKVRAVACGDFHTMVSVSTTFRTDSNKLFAWGNNTYGQLGLCDFMDRSTPHELPLSGMGVKNIPSIACGAMHSAAVTVLKSIGPTVLVWGNGKMGQLGLTRFAEGHGNEHKNMKSQGESVGSDLGGRTNKGMGAKRTSSFVMKIDSKTNDDHGHDGNGTGGGSTMGQDNGGTPKQQEHSSTSAYCTSVPTKLMLHLARSNRGGDGSSGGGGGGGGSGGGSSGGGGDSARTARDMTSKPRGRNHRGSVMGVLHMARSGSKHSSINMGGSSESEDQVGGLMVGGGASVMSGGVGMHLDPVSVSCGANYTAIVLANTPAMRQLGMAGKVFVCGSNSNGQLGQVRRHQRGERFLCLFFCPFSCCKVLKILPDTFCTVCFSVRIPLAKS